MKSLILTIILVAVIVNILRAVLKTQGGKSNASPSRPRNPMGKQPLFPFAPFANQKRNEAWMEAACDYELEYVRPPSQSEPPSLRGDIKGKIISVVVEYSASGNLQTSCSVDFPTPLPMEIVLIRSENLCSRDVADSSIDALKRSGLNCDENDPETLRRFLTEKVRNALRNTLVQYPYLEIRKEYVRISMIGECAESLPLRKMIDFTLSLAEILEKETGNIPVQSPKKEENRIQTPPLPPIQIHPFVPAEPSVILQEKPALKEIPNPVTEPPAPSFSGNETLTEMDVAQKLFCTSFPGASEQEYFKTIEGKSVEWAGELRSAYAFGSDYLLGNGPAVRAVFDIAEITGSYSMKSKIKAVVRLPAESAETLKNLTGKRIRFSGKLFKFEAFAKEIVLLDGVLGN